MGSRRRRAVSFGVAILAGLGTSLFGATGSPGKVDPPARRELFKDSRGLLALLRAQGKLDASVVIAAEPGASDAVAAEVVRLGGVIRRRFDQVGYLRARVPLDNVEALVRFRGVHTADVDVPAEAMPPYLAPGLSAESERSRVASLRSPEGQASFSGDSDWPPGRPDLTLRPVFSPLKDLGGAEWRAQHPQYDGRGVTVAVLDGNMDFLLPEFQVARNLDGTPTRKVIEVLNGQDPTEEDTPQWVSLEKAVTSRSGHVEYAGETWKTPHDGDFRIGVFDVCRFPSYIVEYFRAVMNRPGVATDAGKPIGVLWDEKSNEVWVDANQNHDFSDEKAMKDFHERYDWSLIGTDDPDTPVRETIPFAVQTDPEHRFVAVNVGMYGHSTMVSGALLGSRGDNGLFDGVAPGARLFSIFEGSSAHGIIESMIRAFSDPRVDVVLLEQNVYIAMPYVLNDGRFTATVICSRLIDRYKKPFFSPANNSFGLDTTEEHGMARYGFGVGAYESGDNFYALKAIRVAKQDNFHWVGSFGPSGNGAIQPDIMASSEVLTTSPASREGDGSLGGVFTMPPGYGICGGTSCATPVAAGSVSLLVSAAKQAHVPHDPERLYEAVTTTARWVPSFAAYQQGNGVIHIAHAWDRLSSSAAGERPVTIESRAPVRTVVSGWLEPPNAGPGIYEREGWHAGMKETRTIVFTRTTGPAGAIAFHLRWVGNENGTFASASEIRLPLKKPVSLEISISPREAGVHSAMLDLVREGEKGFTYRTLNTVVAAQRFDAAGKWTIKEEFGVDRPGVTLRFFDVPAGAAALKIDLKAPKDMIPIVIYPPDGRESSVWIPPTEEQQSQTVAQPMAGVWMVVLSNRMDAFKFDESRPPTLPQTPVTLTASLVGVDVTPASLHESALKAGAARDFTFQMKNRFASFQGAAVSTPLAGVLEAKESVAPLGQNVHTVEVAPGTSRLMFQLSEASDPAADLDLYLFDCTGKTSCVSRRSRVGPTSDETLSIDNPAPGTWKLVVDGVRVPGAGVSYRYRESAFNPRFGSLIVAEGSGPRDAGSSWEARAHVWVASAPPDGRRLFAFLPVAGEGIASPRQGGTTSFSDFSLFKTALDLIPLGTATIEFETSPSATVGAR